MSRVVKVPSAPAPAGVCWKQKLDPPRAMGRCRYPANHEGKHQWELPPDEAKQQYKELWASR